MKTFYFIGGPKPGEAATFFERLARAGRPPVGWEIYPHVVQDGKALHLVRAESIQCIVDHLRTFEDIYERSEIFEVLDVRQSLPQK
jgi:hypothetical protein